VALHLALLCLDVVTLAALALIGARVVSAYPRRLEAWLVLLVCAAVMAHVALARAEYGPWIPEAYRFGFGPAAPVLDVVRNLAPGLFALLARIVFTDRRTVPAWLAGLIVLQLALEATPYLLGAEQALNTASALLQLVFAALAIAWTVTWWRVDLIEARRRSRAVVALFLVINGVASSLLLRLVIPQGAYANYLGHLVLAAVSSSLIIFLLVRLVAGDLGPYLGAERRRRSAVEAREREDDQTLARLEHLLADEQAHFEPGLSLARLATRLGTPEYRLRRLIHERLGFRNFNAFLHAHRIRAAAAQLADPTLRRTPILTIALSCGYGSVNTFNRGFREVMGESPSEYRARELATTAAASPNAA
jgi:AraC-like DNA-binding protein